jgi:broad specificity polyphosphatase/5'/3'-nucleotidase SurE
VGLASAVTLGAHALRIMQSNDDGWAELYLRSFHDALLASGHDAVLSGPAENRSGTGNPSRPLRPFPPCRSPALTSG